MAMKLKKIIWFLVDTVSKPQMPTFKQLSEQVKIHSEKSLFAKLGAVVNK